MSWQPWQVTITTPAQHDLNRLQPQDRRRVLTSIRQFAATGQGSVTKLTGRPELRLRVGQWRALFTLDPATRTLTVTRVQPRGRAYR